MPLIVSQKSERSEVKPPRMGKVKSHRSQARKTKDKVIFIVGPTAVGKSKVAVAFAQKINAEIISCDSMQVYKGLDLITSKPGFTLRKKIKHHFIGLIPANEEFNVSKYRQIALKKLKEIIKRGKVPVFAGGTGLYISTLLNGIFEQKYASSVIRKKFYKMAKESGNKYLYEKLKKVDSCAARRIHPNDIRRIIRALEVFEVTGTPISNLQKKREGLSKDYEVKIFCLNMDRASLYKRIDSRVDSMFKAGLLKEAEGLARRKLSRTARYAIGINELNGYFEGLYDLDEAKRLMKRNTRHYAKRQLTWFRKDKRIKWVNIGAQEKPEQIAQRIFENL